MRHSVRKGFSFGITSGIITTLGLIVGLHAGTGSQAVVIGGILTIAVADAFSDALGVHVSEEAENVHSGREIWAATVSTFVAKFAFAMTFVAPLLLLPLGAAIVASLAWGLSLLAIFSYYMARQQGAKPWRVVGEHLLIVAVVIAITHYVGDWVGEAFG